MNWCERNAQNPHVISRKCDCSPESVGYDSERLNVLNQHIQSLIHENRICSGSYSMWRNGQVFVDNSIGNLRNEWRGRKQFKPDTFFELQSVTKVFVAIAILKLAEDGILYLGQPIYEWIPEFDKELFCEITILQLLTHTSGLCALLGVWAADERKWWENMDEANVNDTWIPAIIKTGLHTKPGETWIYSAVGYPLLGEIIKRASGMCAKQFIYSQIMIPCGMMETHWREDATDEWIGRYNICNEIDEELIKRAQVEGLGVFREPTYLWWDEVPELSGGIMSTGREMLKLGEMILRNGQYKGKRIIGRKALEYLWTNLVGENMKDKCWGHMDLPVVYGAGMPIIQRKKDLQQITSNQVIYHEGSGGCVFLLDREEDFAAIFQMGFRKSDDWSHEAMKGTISIIWSGIQ